VVIAAGAAEVFQAEGLLGIGIENWKDVRRRKWSVFDAQPPHCFVTTKGEGSQPGSICDYAAAVSCAFKCPARIAFTRVA
jgi:hypothetical protein